MKKALFALAAAATCATSGAALAQSASNVTLYGIVDAGVEVATHVPGGNGQTAVRMNSGNLSGSRWGLRGVEDLGGGLKGIFTLESGFDIDTGVSGQGNRLFGRQAFVGLQGSFGAVTLGRQQNSLYDLFGAYDPMGVGPRYSLNSVDSGFNGRADNALKYTGKFGGLTATAFYSTGRDAVAGSPGELPGDYKAGRNVGAGVAYTAGGFSIGTAYDQYQGATSATSDRAAKRLAVGSSYDFGVAKVFAGYRWMRDDGIATAATAATRSNVYWLGGLYRVTPALSLTGAAYYTDANDSGNDPWMFVLSADYSFSKRTDAYLNVGYVRNKGTSNLGLSGVGTAVAGQNQTGAVVGVRHRF
ncbi:Outer membrane protein (porin) [Cupriavidus sp. OV038]|uniref:porin n=1 Tax=unclassified Cupriavidus TaxID=2640874 RepID=UPI0008E10D7A|nr:MULTISPECIES: porin [unclassified Cupriavidus]SFC46744.1 Outer membrane protein (porin) [Cupriavidus sp. OV038]SFP34994.1 Outer membrane protein (porin) [Cupriavidus sp. OV096]